MPHPPKSINPKHHPPILIAPLPSPIHSKTPPSLPPQPNQPAGLLHSYPISVHLSAIAPRATAGSVVPPLPAPPAGRPLPIHPRPASGSPRRSDFAISAFCVANILLFFVPLRLFVPSAKRVVRSPPLSLLRIDGVPLSHSRSTPPAAATVFLPLTIKH